MKDKLYFIMGEDDMRHEYPDGLKRKTMSKKMEKKLYDDCAKCKVHLLKSDMITLLARSKRGEQAKQFGFMCEECFKKLCEDLELDVPTLELLDKRLEGNSDA